jgi:hypothetical protein
VIEIKNVMLTMSGKIAPSREAFGTCAAREGLGRSLTLGFHSTKVVAESIMSVMSWNEVLVVKLRIMLGLSHVVVSHATVVHGVLLMVHHARSLAQTVCDTAFHLH